MRTYACVRCVYSCECCWWLQWRRRCINVLQIYIEDSHDQECRKETKVEIYLSSSLSDSRHKKIKSLERVGSDSRHKKKLSPLKESDLMGKRHHLNVTQKRQTIRQAGIPEAVKSTKKNPLIPLKVTRILLSLLRSESCLRPKSVTRASVLLAIQSRLWHGDNQANKI